VFARSTIIACALCFALALALLLLGHAAGFVLLHQHGFPNSVVVFSSLSATSLYNGNFIHFKSIIVLVVRLLSRDNLVKVSTGLGWLS
jgi:hypothetical protein